MIDLSTIAIRLIMCARCEAAPGAQCTTTPGGRTTTPHSARTRPVREAWDVGYGEGAVAAVESLRRSLDRTRVDDGTIVPRDLLDLELDRIEQHHR